RDLRGGAVPHRAPLEPGAGVGRAGGGGARGGRRPRGDTDRGAVPHARQGRQERAQPQGRGGGDAHHVRDRQEQRVLRDQGEAELRLARGERVRGARAGRGHDQVGEDLRGRGGAGAVAAAGGGGGPQGRERGG